MTQEPAGGVPVCYRHPSREAHIRCQRCDRPICPECMVPASVGFHCPECVRDGSKGVRQARTIRLGGSPLVTSVLIGINVVVFLLVQVISTPLLYDLMQHAHGICWADGNGYLADQGQCRGRGTFSPGIVDGGYWELVTSVFTHQAALHLASNMFSLWMLGPLLEGALGRLRYLLTYLLCGLGGSALVYWSASPYSPTLGASGAVFGLMGVLLVMFVRRGLPVQQLVLVVVINFVITFAYAGISWQAHVGGFLTGLALGGILAITPGVRRRAQQWSAYGAVAAAIAVAVAVRSLTL